MAFDDFSLFPKRKLRASGAPAAKNPLWFAHLRSHETRRPYDTSVWRDIMVKPVYRGPSIAWPGDIGKMSKVLNPPAVPEHVPVELWSIDSAKSHTAFISQSQHVWPRLRVGSIIHLMDFAKTQLIFFLTQFVYPGDASIASIALNAAPWSFVVQRAPLDWSKVVDWCTSSRMATPPSASLQKRVLDTIGNYFDRAGVPGKGEVASVRTRTMARYTQYLAQWNHSKECSG